MTVKLYKPLPQDMWFRQKLLADEQTMTYNHAWGGTIDFPQERWKSWYSRWVNGRDNERFYRYVTADSEFVGETAYHFDKELGVYLADVIIHAEKRGRGYGKQALLLLCESAGQNGVTKLFDNIAADNPAVGLFSACGFEEEYRTDEYIMLKKNLT